MQFAKRLQRVGDHMNSSSFAAPGGRGLMSLAKELRTRYRFEKLAGAQVKATGRFAGPIHLHDRSLFSEACTVACATGHLTLHHLA